MSRQTITQREALDGRSPNQIGVSNGMKAMWRRRREQAFHQAVAVFLTHALRPPAFWTTFPAGGGGGLRGAILNGMGLKAGVPDILVFHPGELGCAVIGIELKAGKGKASEAQIDTHHAMTVAGARIGICRTLEEVEELLRRHSIPVHGHVAGARVAA